MYLSNEFLEQYGDFAPHQKPISTFTYLRTYSRYRPEVGRREVWKETASRASQFNIGLEVKHRKKLGLPVNEEVLRRENENLFHNMFNLRQFLSGRTLWVGGAEGAVAEKYALANFNCSFTNINNLADDLAELFYLLLVGTGVGFKCTPKMAAKLEPVRNNIKVTHKPYNSMYPIVKVDNTSIHIQDDKAVIYVGDSKEGWVEAARLFLYVHTKEVYDNVNEVVLDYNYIRQKGERLKTFGGTASGAEPLIEMFTMFEKIIKNQVDPWLEPPVEVKPGYVQLRPIHILDMGNCIGYNVVVGGVRRTAEIFGIGDAPMDWESVFAKYGINGIWDEAKHQLVIDKVKELGLDEWAEKLENMKTFDPDVRPLHHRRMSNNSVAFTRKPERNVLNLITTMMQSEGEPGYVNLEQLAMRRFVQLGIYNPTREQMEAMMDEIFMNPCAEIDLRSKGVCNLTTVNVDSFVHDLNGTFVLDYDGLLEAQRMSSRAGLRMTLITLELPNWDKVQQEDRLLGTSLTGWKDAMEKLGYDGQREADLLDDLRVAARSEADRFAKELRVNAPLLVTTVKPEGTLSIVGNAVSSGLHMSHSPYYIRRIRINSNDPLALAVKDLGWVVNPEVGTPGDSYEEKMENARTLVIDFPVASGAKRTKDDVTVEEQLDTYFRFQRNYCEHNASNTITVKAEDGEWEKAEEIIYNNWDEFTAVSFLALDGGSYELAPYEKISKEKYEELTAAMPAFDMSILSQYEAPDEEFELDADDPECATGACPTR